MGTSEDALIAKLWSLLTADAALSGVVSDRVYLDVAEVDAEFPYIVYHIDTDVQNDLVIETMELTFDVFDDHPNASRIAKIKERLVALLKNARIEAGTGPDVVRARPSLSERGFVPEDDPHVKHYTMAFDVRYDTKRDIELLGA